MSNQRSFYDSPRYDVRQILGIANDVGISVDGSIAAAAKVARVRFPRAGKIPGISYFNHTGGSAGGPSVTANKSLAGTGAATPFGTAVIAGTVADNTGADMTVTATELAAGDHLIINSVAGTAAATPVVSFVIEYYEIR